MLLQKDLRLIVRRSFYINTLMKKKNEQRKLKKGLAASSSLKATHHPRRNQ